MNQRPPRWADRFLLWYCNPELLEEIQGDAYELYEERLKASGKRSADWHYIKDVIRFFRWSNIKRDQEYFPGSTRALWSMNFKMAVRQAGKNKSIFAVKVLGLSLCLAFALLLSAFIVNEVTFDEFHVNRHRIYRVNSKINFHDRITRYAISPPLLGQTLVDYIPEIESSFRFIPVNNQQIKVNDVIFYNEETLAADSNVLNALTFEFIEGDRDALDEPDQIVLTRSLARKLFGDEDAMGKTFEFGRQFYVEVAAVIEDIPANSHLKFDALISWDTYNVEENWSFLNSYNYILLKPNTSIDEVRRKTPEVIALFHDLIAQEYKATFEPEFEPLTEVRFGPALNEDLAEKGSRNNIFVLGTIIILFLITGLINYLNLTMAELTASLKKIGIVRVFGGLSMGPRKILFTETLFTLLMVLPLTVIFIYAGWVLAGIYLSIHINEHILLHPWFISILTGFLILLLLSTRVNSYLLSKAGHVVEALKGKFSSSQSSIPARKFLVGAQLSFSIIMIALVLVVVDQFRYIQNTDKGFDDRNTIIVKFPGNTTPKRFTDAIKKMTGVSMLDAASYYPHGLMEKYVFQVESENGKKELLIPLMNCGFDFFKTLRMKLVEGRTFETEGDKQLSYIINETAAKNLGWKDPIGKSIAIKYENGELEHPGVVIGVVKDFAFTSMHEKIEPLVIMATSRGWSSPYLYIRMDPLHAPDLISNIEREYKALWPDRPFTWEYLDSKFMSLYEKDLEVKNIFEIGLVISILISCLGIFSISALLVTLRTKEMGIRKVVGASGIQLFFLHTQSFLKFLIISIVISWPVIWYLSGKWLENFAYHVPINALYFIIPGMLVLVITIVTSGFHGVKGAMINPVETLKYE